MNEPGTVVVYHYKRGKDRFTTPSREIALLRHQSEENMLREVIRDEESEWTDIEIG